MKIEKCRYIIGCLMLALGLQSCQEHDDGWGDTQYPILFGSSDTRALTDFDDLKDGFRVHAYYERNSVGATIDKKATYDEEENVWGFEGVEYWLPGAQYWFQAFYPSEPPQGAYTLTISNDKKSYAIEAFDINQQVDVTVALKECAVSENKFCPDDGSVIDLSFDHLLACIVVELKTDLTGVTITSVKLSDVKDNGQFNGATATWSSSNETNITLASGVQLDPNADYADVTHGGILVIPADMNDVTLTIEASNKTYSNVPLPDDTWVKGKKYTYRAEIKQSDIVFNEPTVDEWDSDNATGSVIIK